MWSAIGATLLVAALTLIGPYTFLPSLVGEIVARNVQENLGLARTPTVELKNEEPLAMLAGEFSGGRISIRDATFGGVRTDLVTIELDPFDVDLRKSIIARSLVSDDLQGDLRIEISEAEVSRLVESRVDFPVEGVELSEDEMLVNANISLLGGEVPVEVRGGVEIEERELSFLPDGIAVAGTDLPEDTAGELLSDLELSFEIEGFPKGTEIQDARVVENKIVFVGRLEGLPSGGG